MKKIMSIVILMIISLPMIASEVERREEARLARTMQGKRTVTPAKKWPSQWTREKVRPAQGAVVEEPVETRLRGTTAGEARTWMPLRQKVTPVKHYPTQYTHEEYRPARGQVSGEPAKAGLRHETSGAQEEARIARHLR